MILILFLMHFLLQPYQMLVIWYSLLKRRRIPNEARELGILNEKNSFNKSIVKLCIFYVTHKPYKPVFFEDKDELSILSA